MYTEPRLASGEPGPIELFRERLSIVQANTSELLDECFACAIRCIAWNEVSKT